MPKYTIKALVEGRNVPATIRHHTHLAADEKRTVLNSPTLNLPLRRRTLREFLSDLLGWALLLALLFSPYNPFLD